MEVDPLSCFGFTAISGVTQHIARHKTCSGFVNVFC